MRRKLASRGEDPVAYLARRVLRPIELRIGGWERDDAGNPAMPSGASLTAAEWAKFGVLLRDGGRWKGEWVLSDSLLAECRRATAVYPPYGLTLWVNAESAPQAPRRSRARPRVPDGPRGAILDGGPPDLFMAAGAGNQRLYVIPSRGYVIVRFGRRDVTWSDAEFLTRLLDGRIERRPSPTLVPEP
jgi:CubicO group peptidase (beta-lactamase class C family)